MQGKIAIITGGTRGIGLAVSRKLAAEGYSLSIMGRRADTDISATLSELGAIGPVIYTRGDIAGPDDRALLLNRTLAEYGRVDLLVNNAGIAPRIRADLLEMSEESYDLVMETNLKGPLFLSQAVAKQMLRQAGGETAGYPEGMIINIGSISAWTVSLNRSEYCLAKAGLSMMTQLFAARLAAAAIPVFEIQPGIIATDMTAGVRGKYDSMLEEGVFPIPRWGQPEDLAEAVSLLTSGRLAYSTGECLHVDGGFHIRRL